MLEPISNTMFHLRFRVAGWLDNFAAERILKARCQRAGLHLWNVVGISHLAIRSFAATTLRDWLGGRIRCDNLCVPVLGLGSRAKELLAKCLFPAVRWVWEVTNINARPRTRVSHY